VENYGKLRLGKSGGKMSDQEKNLLKLNMSRSRKRMNERDQIRVRKRLTRSTWRPCISKMDERKDGTHRKRKGKEKREK